MAVGADTAGDGARVSPNPGRAVAIVAVTVALAACSGSGISAESATADPERGATIFAATCTECHGPAAAGTAQGPPLVDVIYRSGHHADGAFLVAVRRGVPQHHWDFGAMPPQQGLTDQDVRDVTAYVRLLQQRAGVE